MVRRKKKANTIERWSGNKTRLGTLSTFDNEDHTYSTKMPFHNKIQRIKRSISASDDEGSETPPPVDVDDDSQRPQCSFTPEEKYNSKMTKILKMEEDKGVLWHIHKCKLCPYRSKSIFIMFKHVSVHRKQPYIDDFLCDSNTPEMFQCEPCGFETNLKVDLSEHIRVFHGGKEVNKELKNILKCYRCKKCGLGTHSLLVVAKHLSGCNAMLRDKSNKKRGTKHRPDEVSAVDDDAKTHVLSKSTDFRCAQCSFRSKRKGNLKIHIIRKHIKPEDLHWFKCAKCEYKSKVKYGLKIHMTVNHAEPEDLMNFQCDQCPYKTERNRNLRRHIERMHENPLGIHWYKCGHCPYKTNVEEYLRQHNVRNHDVKNWIKSE